MDAHVVNVNERSNIERDIKRPREGAKPPDEVKSTHFLGLAADNPLDPQMAPFAYFIHRPTGDVTPDHSHRANRVEFVVEGKIEWRERGKPPVEYGAGTLTYVKANTVYGYTVLEDARILIIFDSAPNGPH
jgi:mannose-6-phosphate isomerase-like protein (cupin superfamily)